MIKVWEQFSKEFGPLLGEFIKLNKFKTIVEIGVAFGTTTYYLCEAAKENEGVVHGFDVWAVHGQRRQFPALSNKDAVDKYLREKGVSNFYLTQIDTKSQEFKKQLSGLKKIDFAFIDGDHSYAGVKADFDAVYPLLSDTGMVVFHDTFMIDGSREFMIDLRTKFNDGTYDIIDIPWGNGARRVGISILSKRVFKYCDLKIDEICGSKSKPEDIYKKEKAYYG